MAQGRPRGDGDPWTVLLAAHGRLGWASKVPSTGQVLLPAITSSALGSDFPRHLSIPCCSRLGALF